MPPTRAHAFGMRIVVAVVLFLGACAHRQPVVTEEQRWDAFCRDPPTEGDWPDWCARRAAQRNVEVSQEIRQEQKAENERAEKHRRFERSQSVWKASQVPYQKND